MTDASLELSCPFCGYNLRGTPGNKCSECGRTFDRATMSASQIPWSHRKTIGRSSAFFRTLRSVTLKPHTFAGAVDGVVEYRDALAFRRVVVGLVMLWFVVAFWMPLFPWVTFPWDKFLEHFDQTSFPAVDVAARWLHIRLDSDLDFAPGDLLHFNEFKYGALSAATNCAYVLAALWLATGIPAFFFRFGKWPVKRKNASVALSMYGCGPILCGLLPLTISTVLDVWEASDPFSPAAETIQQVRVYNEFLWIASGLLVILVMALLLRRATRCSWWRVLALAVFVPLWWLLSAGVALVVPLLALLAGIAVHSFAR